MTRDGQQDPEKTRLRRGPLPFPGVAIVGGEEAPVKTSLRRAEKRRGLDRGLLPAKTQTFLRRGNGSSVCADAGGGGHYRSSQRGTKPTVSFPFGIPILPLAIRGSPLDTGGVLIEGTEDAEEAAENPSELSGLLDVAPTTCKAAPAIASRRPQTAVRRIGN